MLPGPLSFLLVPLELAPPHPLPLVEVVPRGDRESGHLEEEKEEEEEVEKEEEEEEGGRQGGIYMDGRPGEGVYIQQRSYYNYFAVALIPASQWLPSH